MREPRRLDDVKRLKSITISVNGKPTPCYDGETLVTALFAAGFDQFRVSTKGEPRAPYCNMGVCFDCMVTVDGKRFTRACLTDVLAGMRVETEEVGS